MIQMEETKHEADADEERALAGVSRLLEFYEKQELHAFFHRCEDFDVHVVRAFESLEREVVEHISNDGAAPTLGPLSERLLLRLHQEDVRDTEVGRKDDGAVGDHAKVPNGQPVRNEDPCVTRKGGDPRTRVRIRRWIEALRNTMNAIFGKGNSTRNGGRNMATDGTAVIGQAANAMADKAGKYLTFKLGTEEYGLEILKVQEIIKMMDITKVPRTPEFVRGVINLRGKVIPVVDLRLKFSMESKETTEKTCVIVVQVTHGGGGRVTMGTIVDEVSEVLDISAELIEPAPEFGALIDTAVILGMAKVNKKVVMLVDIDKVLSRDEVAAAGRMGKVA